MAKPSNWNRVFVRRSGVVPLIALAWLTCLPACATVAQQPIAPPSPLPADLNVPKPPSAVAPTIAGAEAKSGPSVAYPALAQMAESNESSRPLTPNVWLFTGLKMDDPPTVAPPQPLPVGDPNSTAGTEAVYSDADDNSPFWSSVRYVPLPGSLLWEPPMANQREPRMAVKFTNARGEDTIDTAIGGAFSIGRLAPEGRVNEGIEIDAMAAVFTRFNERRLLTAADYRVGMYAAYAKNSWSAKLGYEHTSTHLGDEYINVFGRQQVAYVRDEIVFGLSRRFLNEIRVYGEAGYSVSTSKLLLGNRDRYLTGVEWSKDESTGLRGQPFSALDFDFRSDQNYHSNVTFQLGWQWKQLPSRQSCRLALEVYNGKSPFGQFYTDSEHWVGFTMALDW